MATGIVKQTDAELTTRVEPRHSSLPASGAPGRRRGSARHVHCPLCGDEQLDRPLSEVAPGAESALCSPRCIAGWHALAAVRDAESASDAVATRKRLELETGRRPAPTLSQFLLERWRAGDWTVVPEDILTQLEDQQGPLLGARIACPPPHASLPIVDG